MRRLLFFILLIVSVSAFAQQDAKFKMGLDFNDGAYNKTPMQSKFAGSKGRVLPVVVSLKKWCPIPGNQGHIGSCTGWSSCYGALTMMYAQRENITDKKQITEMAHSGLYVYNLVKKGDPYCDGGTQFPLVLDVLKNNGSCFHKDFDISACDVQPNDTLQKQGTKFAIKDYQSLFSTTDESSLKVQKTKQSLAEGKPVIIGLELRYNFMAIDKDHPVWNPHKGDSSFAGGHAITVIGYDDGKDAFELLNSWGEKWGDGGYCWVKYKDYGKFCKYGFQLFLNNKYGPEPEKNTLSGDFVFQYLTKGNGQSFAPAKISYNDDEGYYETDKKDWKVGQLFQLVAKNTAKDQYIYVFSVDEQNKLNEHFPRNMSNTKDFGFNETPLVSVTDAEIIIPTPESALSIGQAGTDWLVVLFSKSKIDDYKTLVDAIQNMEGKKVPMALKYFFGGRLAKEGVAYTPSKMDFTYEGASDDAIVPLILKVTSEE